EGAEKTVVQAAVRRRGLVSGELMGMGREVGHPASRLLDDQAAGRRIPGMKLRFPKGVEAAAGDVAEVECGRSPAPDVLDARHDRFPGAEVVSRMLATIVREPRRHQCALEDRGVANGDRAAVETCAATPGGRERLVS